MIVKNEAAILGRALESVIGRVHEVIVGDTGSTDGTRALAESLGARVLDLPWTDDFAAARNAVAAVATQPWLLRLDADEALSESSLAWLASELERLAPAIYLGVRHNPVNGSCDAIDVLYPRQAGLAFEGRIHEMVVDSAGRLRRVLVDSLRLQGFDHERDPRREQQKQYRYAEITAAELANAWAPRLCYLHLQALRRGGRHDALLVAYGENSDRLQAAGGRWPADAALLVAGTLFEMGQDAECVEHCRRALAIQPKALPLYVQRGMALERMGDEAGALADFLKALQLADAPPDRELDWFRAVSPDAMAMAARGALYLAPRQRPKFDLRPILALPCIEPATRPVWQVHILLSLGQVEDAIAIVLRDFRLPEAVRADWQRRLQHLEGPAQRALATAQLYALLPGERFWAYGIEAAEQAVPALGDDGGIQRVLATLQSQVAQRH